MLRVAIGPQLPLPSWNWVGFDLTRYLSQYFEVLPFESTPRPCDVLVAVKFLAPQMLDAAPVLYLPIDFFPYPAAIEQSAGWLRRCAAIGCHAEPLLPYFRPYCSRVFHLEHHAKYSLDVIPTYKKRGFVLWIGAFEHVPYLLKWHQARPLPSPLVLCTNVDAPHSRKGGFALAHKLDVPMDLTEMHLNGHRVFPWRERIQRQLMLEARAAVDIKGGRWLGDSYWHQEMKPPTKGQQFVTSGIPFAVNQDSHCHAYFQSRGLTLATPDDRERWLSRAYWEETKRYAEAYRPQLSLENVGRKLQSVIASLQESAPPEPKKPEGLVAGKSN
jgi:hypothetical protein